MILDNNLIAYEYYKNQYVPKEVYKSGEKDIDEINDKYSFNSKEAAILLIEDDIINKDGYGLKKGYYSIKSDKYMDFLYISQTGKLKAKVPVIKKEFFENPNSETLKKEKMSYKKYQRKRQKEYRKYLSGENPDNFIFKSAKIHYLNEQNAYIIIYNFNNVELSGMIKF